MSLVSTAFLRLLPRFFAFLFLPRCVGGCRGRNVGRLPKVKFSLSLTPPQALARRLSPRSSSSFLLPLHVSLAVHTPWGEAGTDCLSSATSLFLSLLFFLSLFLLRLLRAALRLLVFLSLGEGGQWNGERFSSFLAEGRRSFLPEAQNVFNVSSSLYVLSFPSPSGKNFFFSSFSEAVPTRFLAAGVWYHTPRTLLRSFSLFLPVYFSIYLSSYRSVYRFFFFSASLSVSFPLLLSFCLLLQSGPLLAPPFFLGPLLFVSSPCLFYPLCRGLPLPLRLRKFSSCFFSLVALVL